MNSLDELDLEITELESDIEERWKRLRYLKKKRKFYEKKLNANQTSEMSTIS